MPNLAAVKTAFIYDGLPINEKADAAENYVRSKRRRILDSFFFDIAGIHTFQLNALRETEFVRLLYKFYYAYSTVDNFFLFFSIFLVQKDSSQPEFKKMWQ